MATCSLVLDKRVKLKDENYNLSIRIIDGKNQLYLNISKMTESQYNKIFIKKDMGQNTIEFRRQCQEQISRAEKIISEIKVFDRNVIKQSFFKEDTQENQTKTTQISLKLDDLFKTYCEENEHLSIRTKIHIKQSKNVFTRENNDLTILEITPEFLKKIERKRSQEGVSISSINSNFRDLRTVINYFMKKKNILPAHYFYPFGKDGYSICEYFPKKQVFTNDEISKIINLDKFESDDEEFARDIWELLYRCNGINFADLLRLRWDQRNGNCFVFFRKKTENTRKKMRQEIVVPINHKVENILSKIGDKNSPFVLGFLKESYTDENFDYMNRKMRKSINKSLKKISQCLQLSITLQLKTARDSYATVLRRKGVSIDIISEMLSHSNTTVTKHYLDSLDNETVFKINENLI
ncbi:tyrosine-type recombinase/integrase [Chryseobacterium fluminis]|uniref:tyrosine-type recombinase/integrase n=1 Tax=Chryseobacterium fluminis TaxID=2983606 RepID=UPI00224E74E8|nr:tyrosine-type recombinase/integrase [Chryseobacterium sp. MMS21-Ot14]UZT97052.1 tyrosine-type recombinase/integrase [Chryseobacterium sp. MMS21-Ot14]